MIEIKHLSKHYGTIKAIKDINLSFHKGEVISLLGPNGAGKSTFMRLISGYIQASAGEVLINNYNVWNEANEAKKYFGYVPENTPLYTDMRVFEYIRYFANLWQISDNDFSQNMQIILDNLQLTEVLNQRIDTLSKGFKHRVGIAGALIHNPQILILDEPTEGLDPNQKHQIHQFIKNYGTDKLIIISTHIMEEVEAVANRVVLLNKGAVIANTTPSELKKIAPDNDIYSAFRLLTVGD